MRLLRPIAAACALLAVACSDVLIGSPAPVDHASLFDDLWHQFDLHYSYFSLADVNWDSLGAHYRPLATSAATDQEFSRVLAAMLAELRDVHFALSPSGAGRSS